MGLQRVCDGCFDKACQRLTGGAAAAGSGMGFESGVGFEMALLVILFVALDLAAATGRGHVETPAHLDDDDTDLREQDGYLQYYWFYRCSFI